MTRGEKKMPIASNTRGQNRCAVHLTKQRFGPSDNTTAPSRSTPTDRMQNADRLAKTCEWKPAHPKFRLKRLQPNLFLPRKTRYFS